MACSYLSLSALKHTRMNGSEGKSRGLVNILISVDLLIPIRNGMDQVGNGMIIERTSNCKRIYNEYIVLVKLYCP